MRFFSTRFKSLGFDLVLVTLFGFFLGCHVDTTKETAQKTREREREMAKTLEADYEQASGSYESDPSDNSQFWMKVRLDVVKDLSLQPSLSGYVVFIQKSKVSSLQKAFTESESDLLKAPISQGIFDPPSKNLIFTLSGITDDKGGVTVNCKLTTVPSPIRCLWKPATMELPFVFLLRKVE